MQAIMADVAEDTEGRLANECQAKSYMNILCRCPMSLLFDGHHSISSMGKVTEA
jgi:hypothetical protein